MSTAHFPHFLFTFDIAIVLTEAYTDLSRVSGESNAAILTRANQLALRFSRLGR